MSSPALCFGVSGTARRVPVSGENSVALSHANEPVTRIDSRLYTANSSAPCVRVGSGALSNRTAPVIRVVESRQIGVPISVLPEDPSDEPRQASPRIEPGRFREQRAPSIAVRQGAGHGLVRAMALPFAGQRGFDREHPRALEGNA